MASNKELLNKVVTTTSIADPDAGGLLNPKQANRFLDYVFEQAVLMKTARVVRMVEPTVDIDKIDIGQRILRKATEAVNDGVNADPTFSKISMTSVKLRLDWEVSTEGLEDNIEGSSLEDHIASLMARQTANDLEDLMLNGDVTATTDPLLKSFDGWVTRANAGAHVVNASGDNLTRSIFDEGLRALPNKYLQRRSQLAWSTSSTLLQDYIWSLSLDVAAAGGAYNTNLGDPIVNQGLGGAQGGAGTAYVAGVRPFGIPLLEVPLYAENVSFGGSATHGYVELTFPQNRIVGIQRDITIYRDFVPKKDTIEYTQYIRACNQIENLDAYVQVENVGRRS